MPGLCAPLWGPPPSKVLARKSACLLWQLVSSSGLAVFRSAFEKKNLLRCGVCVCRGMQLASQAPLAND